MRSMRFLSRRLLSPILRFRFLSRSSAPSSSHSPSLSPTLVLTLAGTLLLTVLALLPAAPAAAVGGTCSVIAGDFQHVWGGLIRNSHVRNLNVVWTAEDGGRIRHTTDGGVNWTFQTSPPCVQGSLRNPFFLTGASADIGWQAGTGGVVIHTVDAGANWSCIATENDAFGSPARLWDVHFLDPSNGWLLGDHHFRFSTDGGVNWTDVTVVHPQDPDFDPAEPLYYALDFVTTEAGFVGLAAADPGLILRTDHTSGGTVWTVVYDFRFAAPLCSSCAPLPGDPVPPANPFELWDVEISRRPPSLATATAVVSGGFGNQCGHTLASTDGGLTWSQEFHVDDPCNTQGGACAGAGSVDGYPTQYGIHALRDTTAITVGYGGSIAVRDVTCSPPVWRPVPQVQGANTTFTQPLFAVNGDHLGTAWITSMMNAILKTTDGGQTWTEQTVANHVWRVSDVHFDNETDGWTVGQGFRIARTTDGGVHWTEQNVNGLGSGGLNRVVVAPNGLDGVTVGGFFNTTGVKILRTSDGTTWSDPVSITPALAAGSRTLHDVDHTGTLQFWAVGDRSTVLFTSDGGANWENVTLAPGGSPVAGAVLNGVSFASPNTGVVVGEQGGRGRIYLVMDATLPGTRAWTELSPPAADGVLVFQDVAVSGSRAYAVGKKSTASGEAAVVYRWNGSAFVEDTTVPALPPCFLPNKPSLAGLLNRVAFGPSSGDVLVAGSCGRFLRLDSGGWQELKSETSMHFSGVSYFLEADGSDGGVLNASAGSHGVMVRYSP